MKFWPGGALWVFALMVFLWIGMLVARPEAVGWVECVEWIEPFRTQASAKMDTGARSSSLSTQEWRLVEEESEKWIEFKTPVQPDRVYKTKFVDMRTVKSSNGQTERRPVVKMKVRIGNKENAVDFTLTDRSTMQYPALLGRQALSSFVVDPTKKNPCRP